MDEPDRQIAKRVLLRLVSVGSAGATVAVRRTIDDVIASAAADRDEEPRVRSVIDRLLQGRGLAVTVTDSGERVLALAHDALASRWPQLQRWVSEDRDQLRLRSQLEFAASAWEESGKPRQSMLAPRHVEQIVQSVGRDYLTEPELEYAEAAHRRRRQVLVAVIASVLANIILVPLVLLGPSSLLVFGVVLLSFVTFGVAYLAVRLVERLRQP
jgi:hypothetical protein